MSKTATILSSYIDTHKVELRTATTTAMVQGAQHRRTEQQEREYLLALVNNLTDVVDLILDKIDINGTDKDTIN